MHFLATAINPATRSQIEFIICHGIRYPDVKAVGQLFVLRAAEKLAKAGYRVLEAARLGYAADESFKVANRSRVGVIIVGARGHRPVSQFFLGSVSARLLEHTNASVLIALRP